MEFLNVQLGGISTAIDVRGMKNITELQDAIKAKYKIRTAAEACFDFGEVFGES